MYGNPPAAACSSAFQQLPRGERLDKFGDRRNVDWESYPTTLPYRVLSGILSSSLLKMGTADIKIFTADASCFIELTDTEAGGSDEMTAVEIQAAAFNLVTFCVNTQHSGGIVAGLGIFPQSALIFTPVDQDLRQQWGIADDGTAVCAAGRMRHHYGESPR